MEKNEVFEKALSIAVEAHRGQVDRSGMPYILHPLEVARRVDTLELKTIAVLHDVIEDTEITAEDLVERGVPREIVEIVEILTKPKGEDYEEYVRKVAKNAKARKVKLADLDHNTSPERANGLNDRLRSKYRLARKILG